MWILIESGKKKPTTYFIFCSPTFGVVCLDLGPINSNQMLLSLIPALLMTWNERRCFHSTSTNQQLEGPSWPWELAGELGRRWPNTGWLWKLEWISFSYAETHAPGLCRSKCWVLGRSLDNRCSARAVLGYNGRLHFQRFNSITFANIAFKHIRT